MTTDLDAPSDEDLLIAWKQGERRAGATLLIRYHTNVARFFMHKLGPDCDDLVQATFLGLLEGFERFRGESSFRSYLFGVARNQLLTELRERSRNRERFDPGVTSIAALDLSPTKLRAAEDDQRLLLAALRSLAIDDQIMLELHYWEGMRVADIAAAFDLNRNTVKTRMKRGRAQLEREMTRLAESNEQLELSIERLSAWAARLRDEVSRAQDPKDS